MALGLSWLFSILFEFHPSPLGYFASVARWHTRVVCYKGSVQLVNQSLEPRDRTPALDSAAKQRLPPFYEHIPAYPQARTVLLEPLLPGLQWVSCDAQTSSNRCGCCNWSGTLDASWTMVDSAQVAQRRNNSLEMLVD